MKTKVFSKKLILNKKTVANLNKNDMSGLKGGLITNFTCDCGPTGITCPDCDSNVSCSPEACLMLETFEEPICPR